MKYKLILLFGLIALFPSVCVPQESKCNLELKDSPSLRGIKLGMSKAELEASLDRSLTFSDPAMTRLAKYDVARLLSIKLNSWSREKFDPKEDDPLLTKLVEKYEKDMLGSFEQIKVPDGSFKGEFTPNEKQKITDRFRDVSALSLTIYQDRLISMSVRYVTDAFEGDTGQEFFPGLQHYLNFQRVCFRFQKIKI